MALTLGAAAQLIEFIESSRTLDDIHGQEKVKAWLRQDIALWQQNDVAALPKGYLICGPVGTGKTFMVECLAGEARVPVVKLKNFRDKWVDSTEGNLERIVRLLQALAGCRMLPAIYRHPRGAREYWGWSHELCRKGGPVGCRRLSHRAAPNGPTSAPRVRED